MPVDVERLIKYFQGVTGRGQQPMQAAPVSAPAPQGLPPPAQQNYPQPATPGQVAPSVQQQQQLAARQQPQFSQQEVDQYRQRLAAEQNVKQDIQTPGGLSSGDYQIPYPPPVIGRPAPNIPRQTTY